MASENKYHIYFYRTETGKCQACDYARGMDTIVVTNAFLKKSREVPRAEIERSKRTFADWLARRR